MGIAFGPEHKARPDLQYNTPSDPLLILSLVMNKLPSIAMASSNPGNFVLLVLAVWGAISDNRYTAKGGKPAPKGSALKLAAAFIVLFIVLGLSGTSVDSLASLAGLFFVIGFAGYEAWRWFVRRNNPLPAWK
jgi:uncharacterized membrane protein